MQINIAACDYKKITKSCQKCYKKLERKAGFSLMKKSPELYGELLELIAKNYLTERRTIRRWWRISLQSKRGFLA